MKPKKKLTTLSVNHYELMKGKTPKGRGTWAFCPEEDYYQNNFRELGHVLDIKDEYYSIAKRNAIKHFTEKGCDAICLCSEE